MAPEQGDAETALEACQLAQQFQLPELQAALVEQLAASMASNQIGMVLHRAASAGLQELELLALGRKVCGVRCLRCFLLVVACGFINLLA